MNKGKVALVIGGLLFAGIAVIGAILGKITGWSFFEQVGEAIGGFICYATIGIVILFSAWASFKAWLSN